MSAVSSAEAAKKTLKEYVTKSEANLYVVGCFDKNVTVYSQQIRALNLAYALVEAGVVAPKRVEPRIAVVGGGFAGLSLVAGLLRKGVTCPITLFEQHDTLLPLQQGSDTRWLHPRIYDWPKDGSEADVAMLPVLNWTAGRASDVAVQTLASWAALINDPDVFTEKMRLYCNTRHLQIQRANAKRLKIEWVGEPRDCRTGNLSSTFGGDAEGKSELFDLVFLAVGFGLERDTVHSYWRNETFGQPMLNPQRLTRVISGGGDGALIDLLRVRISQYRQDRILDELFAGQKELRAALNDLRDERENDEGVKLFDRFEALSDASDAVKEELHIVLDVLRKRLRRDTYAFLRLKEKKAVASAVKRDLQSLLAALRRRLRLDISTRKDVASPLVAALLNGERSRVSFQNALLVYLLYRCGGFTPTDLPEEELLSMTGIASADMVRRHGPDASKQMQGILSDELWEALDEDGAPKQPIAKILWPGGYFGFHGKQADLANVDDDHKGYWRKEYLPGPTALVARGLCGGVRGFLRAKHPSTGRLRVTLHRVIRIGAENCLQQACDYVGQNINEPERSSSGRTLPATALTIGQAYQTRRIVRSVRGVERPALLQSTEKLERAITAKAMSKNVGYVLAIPILQPADGFLAPSPVAGVLYLDSTSPEFWLEDQDIEELCRLVQDAVRSLEHAAPQTYDRILNVQLTPLEPVADKARQLEATISETHEIAPPAPPLTERPFHFNFDHSDLTPFE